MSSPRTPTTTPCPFCAGHFHRLGNHLRRCKQRGDRDYRAYLARKTQSSSTSGGVCSKCGRRFRRLDTHLRVSAKCRDIATRTQEPTPVTRPPPVTQTMNTISHTTRPQQPHPGILPSLKLPKSSEEWTEANRLLSAVTSSVLQATTAEEKNICLCKGTYEVLASRVGTRPPPCPQRRRKSLRQYDGVLKKVTQLKNQACQALRKAKRQG